MAAKAEIDRAKLRAAIRRLGDEYVYFLLDEALDLVPDSKLAKLVGQRVDRRVPAAPRPARRCIEAE